MRKFTVAAALITGVTGIVGLSAPSAFADSAAGTPVTVEVTGGSLDISAPAGPVDLGSVTASGSAQAVSGQLGTVTVTDSRGSTNGWTATASASDFTTKGGSLISTSAAGSVTYTPGNATVTGTATVTPTSLDALYPGGAVQTATEVDGSNSASWNPTITVQVPAGAATGTYKTTITHSVS